MSDEAIPWKGLHPLSLAVNLAPRTWRTLRNTWPLFAALLIGGRRDSIAVLVVALTLFGLSVASTFVHFLTLGYRVVDGRLELKSGLINRQRRTIDPKRIQNIELVRNPLHTAFGLVELRIETASGREVEGLLSALSVEEGEAVRAALEQARPHEDPSEAEPAEVLARADLSDLLRYGATGLRLGAGLAIAVGLGSEALQLVDVQELDSVPSLIGKLGGAAMLVAFITGLFLLAVAGAIQRFWGFTLSLADGRLLATQGLLTRRRVELLAAKVQLVTVRQPLLRRLLHFGSVHIETAAVRSGERGVSSAEAQVPAVDDDALPALLDAVVPGSGALWTEPMEPPHPRALRRELITGVITGSATGLLLGWWLGGVAWVLVSILPALAVISEWLDYRHQGWRVTDSLVLSRAGYVNRKTHVVSRAKIQTVEWRQGVLLRRWGLAQVILRVAGSRVELPLLGAELARELVDRLTPRPAAVLDAPDATDPEESPRPPASPASETASA